MIDESIDHYTAILSGDYYMFDYSFDASDTSAIFELMNTKSDSLQESINLIDVFDWNTDDNSQSSVDNPQHSSNNNQMRSNTTNEFHSNDCIDRSSTTVEQMSSSTSKQSKPIVNRIRHLLVTPANHLHHCRHFFVIRAR
jgi:hypothetical protein